MPVDYTSPSSGSIRLFARLVTKNDRPAVPASEEDQKKARQLPWFVYLQGGPGFGCGPPQDVPLTDTVLDRGYQLLYLDQRGTGLSSTITAETLALRGNVQQQADYLKLFRADSIVKDCEAVRKALTADYPEHLKKWSVLGQSFGGFCVLTYLSKCPQGLREAFTTGGLAPVGQPIDAVYKTTFQKVIERNKLYYEKFPEDVEAVHEIAYHIKSKSGIKLPSGTTLTVRLFLTLGINFGFHGGFNTVHDLILRIRNDLSQYQFLTRPTLAALDAEFSFENAIIYAILHESIYCQRSTSNWSAERIGKSFAEFPWLHSAPENPSVLRERPLLFSGEMIYPFMFEVFPELAAVAPVADILAKFDGWPELYDEWQLAKNEVPLYALSYVDDMYVDFGFACETVKKVRGCKHAVTNGMHHNAIRSKSAEAFRLLFALTDEESD